MARMIRRNDVNVEKRDGSKRNKQNWYVKTRNVQQIEDSLVKILGYKFPRSVLTDKDASKEIVDFFDTYIWPFCHAGNAQQFIREFKANAVRYSELDLFNRQLQGGFMGGFRFYEFRHVVNRYTDPIRNEEMLFPNASQFVKRRIPNKQINRNWIYESELSEAYFQCREQIDVEIEKLMDKYVAMEQKFDELQEKCIEETDSKLQCLICEETYPFFGDFLQCSQNMHAICKRCVPRMPKIEEVRIREDTGQQVTVNVPKCPYCVAATDWVPIPVTDDMKLNRKDATIDLMFATSCCARTRDLKLPFITITS